MQSLETPQSKLGPEAFPRLGTHHSHFGVAAFAYRIDALFSDPVYLFLNGRIVGQYLVQILLG